LLIITIDLLKKEMKTYLKSSSLISYNSSLSDASEMSEEKKQELMKLEARVAELEKELRRQKAEEEEQEEQERYINTAWDFNFNTESLF
jgi:transcription elongation GreA/GreB family factor